MQNQLANINYYTTATFVFAFFILISTITMSGAQVLNTTAITFIIVGACFVIVGVTGALCFRMIKATEERVAKLEQQLAGEVVRAEGE